MSTKGRRLQKHGPLISWFAKGSPSVCKAIVKEADADLINTFCECAHNITEGNVHLTPKQKRELRPHTRKFGVVLDKKTSIAKKRKSLQTGGFAVALAKAVLPIVMSTLGQTLLKPRATKPLGRYSFN